MASQNESARQQVGIMIAQSMSDVDVATKLGGWIKRYQGLKSLFLCVRSNLIIFM